MSKLNQLATWCEREGFHLDLSYSWIDGGWSLLISKPTESDLERLFVAEGIHSLREVAKLARRFAREYDASRSVSRAARRLLEQAGTTPSSGRDLSEL